MGVDLFILTHILIPYTVYFLCTCSTTGSPVVLRVIRVF